MKCFNGFCKAGVVHADTVNDILEMMGLRVKKEALDAIIAEVDEDGKKFDRVFILINFGHLFTQTMQEKGDAKFEIFTPSGNAFVRVQPVHAPADFWDITFCTRCFWGF